MRHNHWIGFDTLLPKTGAKIEYVFKNGDITSETVSKGVFEGVNRFKHVVLEGQRNTLSASLHLWRLDQNGWILPCEITGTEDADYWLLCESNGRVSTADSIKNMNLAGYDVVAVRPMRYLKAPNWMLNRG